MDFRWQGRTIERRSNYSEQVLQGLQSAAGGGTPSRALAVIEACIGSYSRVLRLARFEPVVAILPHGFLAATARDVLLFGESLWVIPSNPGAVAVRAAHWTISGAADPDSWVYAAELSGPSGYQKVVLPAGGVIHAMASSDPSSPWRGVSPLNRALETVRLAGAMERELSYQFSGPVGSILTMPPGKWGIRKGGSERVEDLLPELKGGGVAFEEARGPSRQNESPHPRKDWIPKKLGASPVPSIPDIRTGVESSLRQALGVPAGILGAASDRESWRRFILGSVSPLARSIAAELSAKLGREISVELKRAAGPDISARASAVIKLVTAGVPLADALSVSGLEE